MINYVCKQLISNFSNFVDDLFDLLSYRIEYFYLLKFRI